MLHISMFYSYGVLLVLRRVKSLLDTGKHVNVVDPDDGIHVRRKLADLQRSGDIDYDKFPQLKP